MNFKHINKSITCQVQTKRLGRKILYVFFYRWTPYASCATRVLSDLLSATKSGGRSASFTANPISRSHAWTIAIPTLHRDLCWSEYSLLHLLSSGPIIVTAGSLHGSTACPVTQFSFCVLTKYAPNSISSSPFSTKRTPFDSSQSAESNDTTFAAVCSRSDKSFPTLHS